MKPTKHIVKPIKNLWNTKRSVWFQKNSDKKLGAKLHREAQEAFNKGDYEEANFKKKRSNWHLGHYSDDESSKAIRGEYGL